MKTLPITTRLYQVAIVFLSICLFIIAFSMILDFNNVVNLLNKL